LRKSDQRIGLGVLLDEKLTNEFVDSGVGGDERAVVRFEDLAPRRELEDIVEFARPVGGGDGFGMLLL